MSGATNQRRRGGGSRHHARRPRTSDRLCFRGILIGLVTGCSWVDVEAILDHAVSDTTLRARRNEWIAAGVFDDVVEEALAAYDRIVGLDLDEVALDGSQHKAPGGGEGTGPSCTDRGRSGWKWSVATDAAGIPVGWVAAAANNNGCTLVAATMDAVIDRSRSDPIGTLHMDRGYDSDFVRQDCSDRGLDDLIIPQVRRGAGSRRPLAKKNAPLGLRWSVERTNSWLSNFGQLRRNTDHNIALRLAQLALAITVLITAKLIDWRNRWSPIR